MKYVMLFGSPTDDTWAQLPAGKAEAIHGEIMSWWQQHAEAGEILGGERLQPGTTATTIRLSGAATPELADGPFIESKEEVSGFGLIEVADLDAAIALAQTWPALQVPGESVEVRPIFAM
jgi:hypothetical protein